MTLNTYYAARATEYDQVYLKPERQADLRAIEHWLPETLAGRRVLEIACGTGYWTRHLAPRCHGVVALDASVETLRIAQTRVDPRQVSWLVGDAYQLPVAANVFDGCFAGFWWSHIARSRIPSFLSGLHATLAPGAMVVLLDNQFVPGSSTPIADRDAEGNTYQRRELADGSAYRVMKNFPSREELLASVAGVAESAQYHEWPHYWALVYRTRAIRVAT